MTATSTRYYIVHSADGRVLAAAPVQPGSAQRGVQLQWRPIVPPGDVVSEIGLSAEEAALVQTSAFLDFEVDLSASTPRLRRRSGR